MASSREIKEKKSSVNSINKITKAMQLVSTAKSQKAVKTMREYNSFFQQVVSIVSKIASGVKQQEEFENTLWVVLASDLGLAGGYNSNIIKTVKNVLKPNDELLILGQKAFSLKRSENDITILLEQVSDPDNTLKIISTIKNSYEEKNMKVNIVNTEYISQLEFKPRIFQLLPIQIAEETKDEKDLSVIDFEPSKDELLKQIIDIYIESTLTGMLKESIASEQTSRRVAMENASKNGEDMLKQLEIEFNRTRQAKITQEISEIIGGAEALK